MKTLAVRPREAEEIQRLVQRVLRDLDDPEPPLDLRLVRELLQLDRAFYSAKDPGTLKEFAHHLRVSAKQLWKRPGLAVDALRAGNFRAFFVPDERRILIDEDLHRLKKRWAEAHEINHSLPDWHAPFLFGDDRESLSPDYEDELEAEANFGAGQMLFLGPRFNDEARDWAMTIGTIKALANTFGNTNASTLWRFVEQTHPSIPMVGLMSAHPQHLHDDFDPANPIRYTIQSDAFRKRFSNVTEHGLFGVLRGYCGWQRNGPLGESDVPLTDDNGDLHEFHFETFHFYYESLTLGVYRGPIELQVATS